MQTPVSTPQKLKQKLDLLLTPGSEKKSLELPSDVDEEFTLLPVPSTAVNPATLDAGSDIVLVHVPNEIDVEKLEGTEILLPCAHQEVGRVGDTYEVSTVQNEDDAGVYVLGIEDNQPSVVKVAALYSLQLALVEPEAEEEGIDQEALEALRAAQTGTEQAPVDEKKKKKKKRKSGDDSNIKSAQGAQKEGKQKKRRNSIPKQADHAVGEKPSEDVPVKKKKKKSRSSVGT